MEIACTVFYPDLRTPNQWKAPGSALRARMENPNSLLYGNGKIEIRLDFTVQYDYWRAILTPETSRLFGMGAIIASCPDDLNGNLLVFQFTDAEDPTFLYAGAWLSSTLADLLQSSAYTALEPEESKEIFDILVSRAHAEAVFATERAVRLEKKQADLAAKNYYIPEENHELRS
jgi:hypothetical protein